MYPVAAEPKLTLDMQQTISVQGTVFPNDQLYWAKRCCDTLRTDS